jgi:hypothetical protein
MTFLELQNDALDECDLSIAPSSPKRAAIKRSINKWQRRLLTRPVARRLLRDGERTLTTAADQAIYGLTLPMGRLLGIRNPGNDQPLVRRDLTWLRRMDPGLRTKGNPAQAYIVRGWSAVERPPSVPSAIFVVSTNVLDDALLSWEYILSDGSRRRGTTGMGGITPVQVGAATTVIEITVAYVADHTSPFSTITLRQGSGAGPVLASFYPGAIRNRYLQVQLWPTPAGAMDYSLDYTREIVDMTDDLDEPLLSPDFHYILSLGAQHDEWRRRGDSRYRDVRQDLEVELKNFNAWWDLPSLDNGTDPPMQGRSLRRSRLGPWYPAGS